MPDWLPESGILKIRYFANSVLEYGVRSFPSPVRSSISRPQYGVRSGLKLRIPVRSTELESGVRYGARFPDPSTECAPDSNSVLQYGVHSGLKLRTPYWSTEYCIAEFRTEGAGLRTEIPIFRTGIPNSPKRFIFLMFPNVLVPYSVPVRSTLRTQTPY